MKKSEIKKIIENGWTARRLKVLETAARKKKAHAIWAEKEKLDLTVKRQSHWIGRREPPAPPSASLSPLFPTSSKDYRF